MSTKSKKCQEYVVDSLTHAIVAGPFESNADLPEDMFRLAINNGGVCIMTEQDLVDALASRASYEYDVLSDAQLDKICLEGLKPSWKWGSLWQSRVKLTRADKGFFFWLDSEEVNPIKHGPFFSKRAACIDAIETHGVDDPLSCGLHQRADRPAPATSLADTLAGLVKRSKHHNQELTYSAVMKALRNHGMPFHECTGAYGENSSNPYVSYAKSSAEKDVTEVDDVAVVAKSDYGAFVMTWMWVSDRDVGIEPDDSDGDEDETT